MERGGKGVIEILLRHMEELCGEKPTSAPDLHDSVAGSL